jgi:type I restriction enzyme S subunit
VRNVVADGSTFLPAALEEQRRIVARIEELAAKIEEARGLRRKGVEEAELLFPSALESLFERNNVDWRYEKLAENGLATVVAGQHIMAEEYNLSGDGIPYLTGPADFGDRVAEIKRWTLTPKSTALPGDILLTVKGAGVGKINFAPDIEVAIGRQLMAIRPNPSRLLCEFIYFFLEHKFEHFRSIATATTVPGFKKSDVEELYIPVVDLAEQRDIVDYLDSLQIRIDFLRKIQSETSTELDALLPSILDKAFKGEL